MDRIRSQFEHELYSSTTLKQLEEVKVNYLGRKGLIQNEMQALRLLPPDQKKQVGQELNRLKQEIENKIALFQERFEKEEMENQLVKESLDVTLPGRSPVVGNRHPVMVSMDKMVSIFKQLGFSVQLGPQIDTEYFNFDSLNFAEDHPAKDMQDTFYFKDSMLLPIHS